jgi:glucokinase
VAVLRKEGFLPSILPSWTGGHLVNSSESSRLLLALDIGGSHVSAALCALDDLRVLQLTSAPLAGVSRFDGFVDLLYLLGREVGGPRRLAGGALAVPGPFDCIEGVSLMKHKLEWLYGRDLRGALAARFGWASDRLRFLNDAAAFLTGELAAGSARGANRAVGLTLGTGIGSAFAIQGKCVTEGKGVPPGGEIWNFPYGDGTVEDLISTRALKADYAARTGKPREVKAIAEAAVASDPDARRVFERLGNNLGQVIRDVIAPFQPEVAVVGGGMARSARLFLPIAQKLVDCGCIHLLPSRLLEKAQLIGAAAFWRDQHNSADTAPAARPKPGAAHGAEGASMM